MRPALAFAALAIVAAVHSAEAAPVVSQFANKVYQNLYGITADSTGIYVTGATGVIRDFNNNPDNGVIGFIPYTGGAVQGAVQTLYSKLNYVGSGHVAPFQITTDGAGTLYWADPDAGPGTGASFMSAPVAGGGGPSMFFGICCGPGVLPGDGIGLALSGGTLFFSDGTGGRIGSAPSGSTATQIGPTRYNPDFNTEAWSQIAVVGSKIFIADSAQQRGADNGTTATYDESASVTPAVRWISTDGSSGFQTLTVGKIPHPQGIVAVGKLLYVTSGKIIWTVNQKTGATRRFLSNKQFVDLQGITYYNGAFYVADSQNIFKAPVNGVADAKTDKPGIVWKIVP